MSVDSEAIKAVYHVLTNPPPGIAPLGPKDQAMELLATVIVAGLRADGLLKDNPR